MTELQRPLVGCRINLSCSESEDSATRGHPSRQVNRVTLRIVAALFGQGASVIFGHDWREDGVMAAIYGFARQMQPPIPVQRTDSKSAVQPLLWNVLPWPDKPYLPEQDLQQLAATLLVESAGLPEELCASDLAARDSNSPLFRYVRARGLTHLRHRLDDIAHARLCLGGRRSGSSGRYPGVIEEAFLAVRAGKPLYLAGVLGGATSQVIEAIEGRRMPDEFCSETPVKSLYDSPPVNELDSRTKEDRIIEREAVWAAFAEMGRKRIAEANGLTTEENEELLHTRVLDRVIELVLTGVSRLRPQLVKH